MGRNMPRGNGSEEGMKCSVRSPTIAGYLKRDDAGGLHLSF